MMTEQLAGKTILIVGIYYRPEKTGIAPYTTAVAEHLASRQAQVVALTGLPHYPAWQIFRQYRGKVRMRERLSGVDVRRLRTYVPTRQTAFRRGLYEASYGVQAITVVGLSPDVVLGVIPTLAGGAAAAFHAARSKVPLGLIVQDLTGPAAAQSGMPGGGGRVARLTSRLERCVLRRADRIASVSEGFWRYMEEAGIDPARLVRLPNWTNMPGAATPPARTRRELGWPVDAPVILHAGNMGLKQGLEHVVAAADVAQSARPELRFAFMGEGSQRGTLERRAVGLRNVSFHEPRYGEQFADALAAADILLVNERASVLDMSLPSKLTSYFAAGRPVLAAVAPGGVTAREVERSGGGIVAPAENPAALLDAIERLTRDEALARRLADCGRRYAEVELSAPAGLSKAEGFVTDLLRAGHNGAQTLR